MNKFKRNNNTNTDFCWDLYNVLYIGPRALVQGYLILNVKPVKQCIIHIKVFAVKQSCFSVLYTLYCIMSVYE